MRKNMGKTEEESLKDLERIVKRTKKWGLNLVIIGGYAVRAYTRGYRYTKDIDLVSPKREMGGLIALLKGFNYKVRKTRFGLAGRKKLNGGFIDIHISVEEVWDVSTDKRYPVSEILKESKIHEISGYFEEGRKIKVKAFVVPLEDLLILKLMTKGREKDVIDVISLFVDKWEELDLNKIVSRCSKAELNEHIKNQSLQLIGLIRTGKVRKIWFSITGQRLMRKTETELIKHLKEMGEMLI